MSRAAGRRDSGAPHGRSQRSKATPGEEDPRPGRVLAVVGAAAITLLSVGGAVGIVPGGAALGATSSHRQVSAGNASSGTAPGASSSSAVRRGSYAGANVDGHRPSTHARSAGGASATGAAGGAATDGPTAADPGLPAHSGSGKRVVFDQSEQRVWLVSSDGSVVRSYLVSGSKTDNLTPGTYHVYARQRHTVSFNYKETMNYMVSFTSGEKWPIGFHDIPAYPDGRLAQSRSDLGTPESAGCIRQWIGDAKALWRFAPLGTTVVVVA
jgi:lipoprotein-anchoring transpeptidase ErfK/SrfK